MAASIGDLMPRSTVVTLLLASLLLGMIIIPALPSKIIDVAEAATLTTITIRTKLDTGTSFSGAMIVLKDGVNIDSKPSPATFTVTADQKYTVTPQDTADAVFKQWGSGSTTRSRTITASTTGNTLIAIYEKTSSTTCGGSSGGAYTVTVISCTLDGILINGYYVNLRENGNIVADGYTPKTFTLTPGKTYVVVLYWCCDHYFRHYSDGTLTRYYTVTGGSTGIMLKGMYERVPASQAAKLNVIAQDTNGNVIGGTTINPDGSIAVEPGMWMWLTPPGSSSPYTGAFTGSSSTPFVVFNGATYKITMSSFDKYQFDHWKDTGSTNPNRSFSTNGDKLNNVAVYRIVSTTSSDAAAALTPAEPPPAFIDVDDHEGGTSTNNTLALSPDPSSLVT